MARQKMHKTDKIYVAGHKGMVGIFPTVIAFWSWNESIRRIGAGRAMAIYNMLPIYGTLFGIIFLKKALLGIFYSVVC